MVVVPAATPVNTPDAEPISAMLVFALLQVPPVGLEIVKVPFTQTLIDPGIAAGTGFTVITLVLTAVPQLLDIV